MTRVSDLWKACFVWLGMISVCQSQIQSPLPAATSLSPAQIFAATILAKAGLPSVYKPLSQCQASGTMDLYTSPANKTTAQASLTITSTGTTTTTVTFNGITRTTSYRAGSGTAKREHFPPAQVPIRTALLSQRLYLPTLELSDVLNDPNASVSLKGPSTVEGESVYTLTATGHWNDIGLDPTFPAPAVTYLIDATTLQIVSRQDIIQDPRGGSTQYTRVFHYANYQPSGSLTLPNSVTEMFQGATVASTTWNTLTVSF